MYCFRFLKSCQSAMTKHLANVLPKKRYQRVCLKWQVQFTYFKYFKFKSNISHVWPYINYWDVVLIHFINYILFLSSNIYILYCRNLFTIKQYEYIIFRVTFMKCMSLFVKTGVKTSSKVSYYTIPVTVWTVEQLDSGC